ncbi:MAG: hypothetical protein PVG66_07740 [Chromatiales bacterium]|jgi:hypothetical protein
MKSLILSLLLTTSAFAQPVFLNIPAETNGSPAMTIPTANQQTCERLMNKLAKEPGTNFYLSCSVIPMVSKI